MIHALAVAALSFLIVAAAFVPLERTFPARAQPILRPGLAVDGCFFLGQYFLFAALSGAATDEAERLIGLAPLDGARAFLAARPALVQVAAAVALGDLAVYWLHRAFHRFDFLWRFHAVHHSAEHLDWMAAYREHPADGVLTQLTINLPAILLGVPGSLCAAAFAFRGAWAIFVHSNVRLPLGPLRILFGAPELHHWHHARRRTEHNFANLAPYLDLLFGTYRRPPPDERYAFGLTEPWPSSWLGQLARPFIRR